MIKFKLFLIKIILLKTLCHSLVFYSPLISSDLSTNKYHINYNITVLNNWLIQINTEYEILNKYSAYYVWKLSTNPTDISYNRAAKIGLLRIKWKNYRCNEAKNFNYYRMNSIEKRMIYLLCRGPKYTVNQASQLSLILDKIQNIYTETKICLPKSFDICQNHNKIWYHSYIKTPERDMRYINMSSIINFEDKLNYYNKNSKDTDDNKYFINRIINKEYLAEFNEQLFDQNIQKYIVESSSSSICMNIEPELENVMTGEFRVFQRSDCTLPIDLILHWTWEIWRYTAAQEIGKIYPNAIYLMNIGAQNNGYQNIGECWREELEMNNLRSITKSLWLEFKPYYKKFHSILRNALWKKFSLYKGKKILHRNDLLPAHLLGNMWAQDWSSYNKLLIPFPEVDLDENFSNLNWTTVDMVKRVDDFYSSLGLNRMTNKFWKYSIFNKNTNSTKCHGSAANMFQKNDFRIIVCAERKLQDFYVIIHEMGHIQYYMNAKDQPPLLQDATNSAFNEAIGDAIHLAMMTPIHLNRLQLLSDENLFVKTTSLNLTVLKLNFFNKMRIVHEIESNSLQYNIKNLNNKRLFKDNMNENKINSFDIILLLRIALSKLPQIPFEYVLDVFRWNLFSGKIQFNNANNYYWKLIMNEQGVRPPNILMNRQNIFDAGSKFHIADNTPYIRYFLSSFLHVQIFKGLCEKTIFNKVNTNQKLPMPLHRCDIYGSKRAGELLKKALKFGASKHWTEILYILTGKREISVKPLIEYYQPLFEWINSILIDFNIPIGW